MREVTICIYNFNELSPKAQNKAINQQKLDFFNQIQYFNLINHFKQQYSNDFYNLKNITIEANQVNFEFDGLSKKILNHAINELSIDYRKKKWLKKLLTIRGHRKMNNWYFQNSFIEFLIDFDEPNSFDINRHTNFNNLLIFIWSAFEKNVRELYQNVCNNLYHQLFDQNSFTSGDKEKIIKDFHRNQNTFLIDGTINSLF